MQFPIHIELRRSRLLVFFLVLFHALAVACVVVLPWSWLIRSLLLATIGLSVWRTAPRASGITGLRLAAGGKLECSSEGGERSAALILPDSVVFSHLIVLRMRIGDAQRISSLALLPDSMSTEQFRLLRLWLRWRGEPGASESAAKGV